jgi:hypothetical protein
MAKRLGNLSEAGLKLVKAAQDFGAEIDKLGYVGDNPN